MQRRRSERRRVVFVRHSRESGNVEIGRFPVCSKLAECWFQPREQINTSCVMRPSVASKRALAPGALEGPEKVAWGKASATSRLASIQFGCAPAGAPECRLDADPTPLPGRQTFTMVLIPGASRGTAVPRSAPGYRPLPHPGQKRPISRFPRKRESRAPEKSGFPLSRE